MWYQTQMMTMCFFIVLLLLAAFDCIFPRSEIFCCFNPTTFIYRKCFAVFHLSSSDCSLVLVVWSDVVWQMALIFVSLIVHFVVVVVVVVADMRVLWCVLLLLLFILGRLHFVVLCVSHHHHHHLIMPYLLQLA